MGVIDIYPFLTEKLKEEETAIVERILASTSIQSNTEDILDATDSDKNITIRDYDDNMEINVYHSNVELIYGMDAELSSVEDVDINLGSIVFLCCYGVYGLKENPYLSYLMHKGSQNEKSVLLFPYGVYGTNYMNATDDLSLKEYSRRMLNEIIKEPNEIRGYIKTENSNEYYVFVRIQKNFSVELINSEKWFNVLPSEIVNYGKCVNIDIETGAIKLFMENYKISYVYRIEDGVPHVLPFTIYQNQGQEKKEEYMLEIEDKQYKEGDTIERFACVLPANLYVPIEKEGNDKDKDKENDDLLWDKYGSYMIKGNKLFVDSYMHVHRVSKTII